MKVTRPNQVWVADFTYIQIRNEYAYLAVELDIHTRRCLGWSLSRNLDTTTALDALQMALYNRRNDCISGLVHHSDRGSQYLSIRYTERLAEVGAVPSVGSVGDSYDNALAETIIGLFKTEVIDRRGPWRHLDGVEYATLEWVDWFNNTRLLEPIGYIPPAELERAYYDEVEASATVAGLT